MWVFERAPDTRRDPDGTRGLWWVGGNRLFIKFSEESALVRGPGVPEQVPALAQHGIRMYDKIVKVDRSNKRKDHKQGFTQEMRPPRKFGYDAHAESLHQSTKHVRTYRAAS